MYVDNGGKVICVYYIEGDFFVLNVIFFYRQNGYYIIL